MKKCENQIIVIFGASGDLTYKKLIPALYHLHYKKLLPEKFAVMGLGRTKLSHEEFRDKMKESIVSYSQKELNDFSLIKQFTDTLYYYDIDTASAEGYKQFAIRYNELKNTLQIGDNALYYLSTPPSLY
ncbi:MAG: glucose-6-phosphate dehydrogenase, partial [Bacteroidales bacterium]